MHQCVFGTWTKIQRILFRLLIQRSDQVIGMWLFPKLRLLFCNCHQNFPKVLIHAIVGLPESTTNDHMTRQLTNIKHFLLLETKPQSIHALATCDCHLNYDNYVWNWNAGIVSSHLDDRQYDPAEPCALLVASQTPESSRFRLVMIEATLNWSHHVWQRKTLISDDKTLGKSWPRNIRSHGVLA